MITAEAYSKILPFLPFVTFLNRCESQKPSVRAIVLYANKVITDEFET